MTTLESRDPVPRCAGNRFSDPCAKPESQAVPSRDALTAASATKKADCSRHTPVARADAGVQKAREPERKTTTRKNKFTTDCTKFGHKVFVSDDYYLSRREQYLREWEEMGLIVSVDPQKVASQSRRRWKTCSP